MQEVRDVAQSPPDASRRNGRVLLPKRWDWDRSIPEAERNGIIERVLLLPAWVDNQLEAQNLDVKKIEGSDGLYRLRDGDVRVIFQILGGDAVVHRIAPRSRAYDRLDGLALVRSREGFRTLVTDPATAIPVSGVRAPVQRPARFEIVSNPLSVFGDAELRSSGLGDEAIAALRTIPPEVVPDEILARLGVKPHLIRLIAELWEDPVRHLERLGQGASLDLELIRIDDEEAAARIRADLSSMSVLSVSEAASFARLLDRPVEDWMVYLHPEQRRAIRLSADGPVRVRGGAGTGKTVVALHRARQLALPGSGPVLLTTFVNTLPRVWEGLFASFAPQVAERIEMRTVDSLAASIYREGGGALTARDSGGRNRILEDLWRGARGQLNGLSSRGLQEEFDYMISGRGIASFEEYRELPRTGRGSPLPLAARSVVWKLFEEYSTKLEEQGLIGYHELRCRALELLESGAVRRRYAAVVVDEAQDLTEVGIRMLASLVGGGDRPSITIVGDGQQSIYPGGFSLRSLGIDVRGRAIVLDTNWRNTWAIWMAARAFVGDDRFDDLDEDDAVLREDRETPLPIRYGQPARLHLVGGGDRGEAEWVAMLVQDDLANGADPGDCAVVHPFNKGVERLESALKGAGVPVLPLKEYAGMHRPNIWVGTFHRVKGLEFKRVYVTGLSAGSWPVVPRALDPVTRDEERRRAVRAAFVALTRARDSLDVVCGGAPAAELERARWAFDE